MADGPVADIRLGDLLHGQSCLHTHLYAQMLQGVSHGQRIHGRGQHTDLIRTGTLHLAAGAAAPKVAAAHHDRDLSTQIMGVFDAFTNGLDGIHVQAKAFVPGQRLPAQFQQHAFVFHRHSSTPSKQFHFLIYFT